MHREARYRECGYPGPPIAVMFDLRHVPAGQPKNQDAEENAPHTRSFAFARCFPAAYREGRGLSDPARHPHRCLYAGRGERCACAHRRAQDGTGAGRADRDRQPSRRRRQRGGGGGRPRHARWLYDTRRQQRDPRHQCGALQEDQLRCGGGFRADRPDRLASQYPGGEPVRAGALNGRADRAREGTARQAQLRLFGLWACRTSRGRIVQRRGQDRHRARALQGRGAGIARRDRRPRADDVRHRLLGRVAHQGRQGARARGHHAQAFLGDARDPDHRRARPQGLRRHHLARPGGARAHPERRGRRASSGTRRRAR